MPAKKPILVTGSHRSGTTWIGRTIAKHPKVRYVQDSRRGARDNVLESPSACNPEELEQVEADNLRIAS